MGLYLCVFDDCGEEIAGVEVWRYQYFGDFRDLAAGFVRKRKVASSMTTLLNHPDCNGIWSVKDCKKLLSELEELGAAFRKEPPLQRIIDWRQDVFRLYGITPQNLFECFVDSDCEFLIDRLTALCRLAIQENRPIEFQ
ncbi:MAG: hypothetical protein HFF11_01215 [Angelakisella sp.]|jgi:hypothetical protein|nr:hypothetical protein [Angelakisella sp.]